MTAVLMSKSPMPMPVDGAIPARALADAIEAFNEASDRLEARHHALLRETEQLREQLRRKEDEVKRAERLATLGQMSAALAHEVRNPLGAIKLFVSLLKEEVGGSQSARTLLEETDRSIVRLDGVIGNILQFSRGGALVMAPCNMHALVNDLVGHFRALSQDRATFELSLKGGPFVVANETAVRQALGNVIGNALQATAYRGVISVSTCEVGEELEVVVRDNGPGFESEALRRAFEPFVTSKNGGTGLGLAVVKMVAEAHGGSARVSNDGGARVEMRFARAGASAKAQRD